jgi:hypothetical protein
LGETDAYEYFEREFRNHRITGRFQVTIDQHPDATNPGDDGVKILY